MKLASISVDLDEIYCYAQIHGLHSREGGMTEAEACYGRIYEKGLMRIAEWLHEEGIKATFFIIGRDIDANHPQDGKHLEAKKKNQEIIRMLKTEGHEMGNHSYTHAYDLSTKPIQDIMDDLSQANDIITAITGSHPVGFRAPGYTLSRSMVGAIQMLGFEYDSSIFPCPAYYAAKASALAWIRMRGRESRSILDEIETLSAKADPYRMGNPYWTEAPKEKTSGLVEIPMGVSRDALGRLPFIGTSVAMAGARGAKQLTQSVMGRPLVHLEMHAIDMMDATDDGLLWLAKHQPDLKKSAKAKKEAFKKCVRTLQEDEYHFVRLKDVAKSIV